MTNPNVRPDLEALKSMLKAATPTPWGITENEGMDEAWCDWHRIGNLSMTGGEGSADSSLARAAVNTLPDLIAHIERLEDGMRRIAALDAVPISDPHAGATNGKALLQAKSIARATLSQGTS